LAASARSRRRGDEFVLATCEAAAVDYVKIDAHDYFNRHRGNSAFCFGVLETVLVQREMDFSSSRLSI